MAEEGEGEVKITVDIVVKDAKGQNLKTFRLDEMRETKRYRKFQLDGEALGGERPEAIATVHLLLEEFGK